MPRERSAGRCTARGVRTAREHGREAMGNDAILGVTRGATDMATKKKDPKPAAKAAATTRRLTPHASDVASAWRRIEAWFALQHPGLPLRLRPAATEKQIATAEKTLGVRFPEDFRASLLVHDGQDEDPGVRLLPFAQRLGSLDSLVRCWKDDRGLFDAKEMAERMDWLDDAQRVRQVHLHPRHVPIAGSKYWDYGRLLVDYIPGPAGQEGQIIARDDVEHEYVCASFGELLARTADGLEEGRIVVEKRDYDSELVYLAKKGGRTITPAKFFA